MSPRSATETVEALEDLAENHAGVCIADVFDEFGKRRFGPFLFIPALIDLKPIGGLLGVPNLLAAMIALVAVQLLLGRDHVWLPEVIQRRAIGARKLMKSAQKLEAVAGFLNHRFKGRLERSPDQRCKDWPRRWCCCVLYRAIA